MTSLLHHEAPTTIRARAAALTEYLLAVRAQMEKPARTVPTGSAIWQNGLPEHPDCRLGPRDADSSWLSVGRPPKPKPLATPGRISSMLFGPIEATREPVFRAPSGLSREEVEDRAAEVAEWVESTWRPWAVAVRRITATRELHARLIELRSRLDMNAAGEELVWGHGVVHVEVAGHRVAYPLVATPVAVDYDADRAVVSASPQGPARLQTDALTGLDDQSLRQLLGLGDGGLVAVDLWDDLERRELFERALRRLGHDPVLRMAHAPAVGGAHIHDTGVLFVGPRQRMLRRFLEQLRDRLLAGDTETIGALAVGNRAQPPSLCQ